MLLLSGQSGRCVETCPAKHKSNVSRKALKLADQLPIREVARANWERGAHATLPVARANYSLVTAAARVGALWLKEDSRTAVSHLGQRCPSAPHRAPRSRHLGSLRKTTRKVDKPILGNCVLDMRWGRPCRNSVTVGAGLLVASSHLPMIFLVGRLAVGDAAGSQLIVEHA